MKTILIVDDSEGDQFYTGLIFEAECEGILILSAYDGQEALNVLKKHKDKPPDLILLDINMPRMNGHEFLTEHAKNTGDEIPVIVMLTSSDQERDKEQALAYACVKDYLLKPLKADIVPKLTALVDSITVNV